MSDDFINRETARLKASWMQHDGAMLRDYLVADVEDPRINVQSILSRHFLIQAATGKRFVSLMKEELRFAVVMNWLLQLLKKNATRDDFASVLHALEQGGDDAEGIAIPNYVSNAWRELAGTDNYIAAALAQTQFESGATKLPDTTLAWFQNLWQKTLAPEAPTSFSVIEPACGSANDYRFLAAYGISRLIDYTGFDLCDKNIQNAREMFPQARFETGNVLQINRPDQSFDLCFVHDLLEHLSIPAMEQAVAELCRVTRQAISIGFFSMFEAEDHIIREVEDYHWNTLSMDRICRLFAPRGFEVQVIHIGTLLKWRFGCEQTHNQNAYTVVFRRDHHRQG